MISQCSAKDNLHKILTKIQDLPMPEAARALAEAGLQIFPCRPMGKEPATGHGYKDATTDLAKIKDWWQTNPHRNIGLPCAPNGLVVLDEDPRNGAKAADLPEPIPDTLMIATPSGGRHYYFHLPDSFIPVTRLAPGWDVKYNGYVLVPPSAVSGQPYKIITSRPIAPAPAWLLATRPQTTGAAEAPAGRLVEGERNNALFRLAAGLRARGLTQEEILAALRVANQNRCDPPLPEAEVERIARSANRYPPGDGGTAAPPGPEAQQYIIDPDGTYYLRPTKNGPVLVQLANFSARIVRELIRDDGAERQLVFEIAGELSGKPLPRLAVPAHKFAAMAWPVEGWGAGAVVAPGQGTKDLLRAAIQLLSRPDREIIYSHSGWRRINGKWCYLHAGGAVGPDGSVNGEAVDLPGCLSRLLLPDPPRDPAAVVRQATEALLATAPLQITAPLLGAVARAPLIECLPAAVTLYLCGPTGTGKSTLAGLAQAFYGSGFGLGALPANWQSTGNYLEKLMFYSKDALLTADDYAPRGSGQEIRRLEALADRVIRGLNNQQARGRMTATGELRPAYPPRALLLVTGEDLPSGQSLRARLLAVQVGPGAVDWAAVTRAQAWAADGVLAQALVAYLRWLAPRLTELRQILPDLKQRARDRLRQQLQGYHRQTPDLLADLWVGLETWGEMASGLGVGLDLDNCWRALVSLGREQAALIQNEDPCRRFLELLQALLLTGRGHLATPEGDAPPEPLLWGWRSRDKYDPPEPQGDCLGWVTIDQVLLNPDAAYAAVQKLAAASNAPLPLSQATLWKRLAEQGWLIPGEGRNLKAKARVLGKNLRVIKIPMAILSPHLSEKSEKSDFEPNCQAISSGYREEAENGKSEHVGTGAKKVGTDSWSARGCSDILSSLFRQNERPGENVGTDKLLKSRAFSAKNPTVPTIPTNRDDICPKEMEPDYIEGELEPDY